MGAFGVIETLPRLRELCNDPDAIVVRNAELAVERLEHLADDS
jgi:hypothetical protein